MRPEKIILVRHGESEGNVDAGIYRRVPDHRLQLTERGRLQALATGRQLRALIGSGSIYFYVSPYERTRQTYQCLCEAFPADRVRCREEPRLREQDFGHLREQAAIDQMKAERRRYGSFYYRIADGESGADVYDRVSTFLDTLHRDFEKPDYPEHTIIVTHGLTLRLFLMRWFHWTVEKFERLWNPENGGYVVMERQPEGRYRLITPLREDGLTERMADAG